MGNWLLSHPLLLTHSQGSTHSPQPSPLAPRRHTWKGAATAPLPCNPCPAPNACWPWVTHLCPAPLLLPLLQTLGVSTVLGHAPLPCSPSSSPPADFGCEYCPGGDLYEQVQARGRLPLEDARFYVAEAVQVPRWGWGCPAALHWVEAALLCCSGMGWDGMDFNDLDGNSPLRSVPVLAYNCFDSHTHTHTHTHTHALTHTHTCPGYRCWSI